jgi:monoamine oxidase
VFLFSIIAPLFLAVVLGAFAFFGPGVYTDIYPAILQPAARGKLFFAGEATSTGHAYAFSALILLVSS